MYYLIIIEFLILPFMINIHRFHDCDVFTVHVFDFMLMFARISMVLIMNLIVAEISFIMGIC